jgi:hypothetical protein
MLPSTMPLQFSGADMSKPKRKKEKKIYHPPKPPRWKGSDSVDLAYQLNQRAFGFVRDIAAAAGDDWPFIAHDRELWAASDAGAIERAARVPFVVVQVHFTDVEWWRADSKPMETSQWPAKMAEQLMGELLVFAWHTVKWDRRVARLALGVVPGVAELIAAMTPHQLDTLSQQHCGALSLRWQGNAALWTRLLKAARDDDEEALADIHLHAKLLLSGELISVRR